MGVVIVEEPTIYLTRSQYEKYLQQYRNEQKYTTRFVSFEEWVRGQIEGTKPIKRSIFGRLGRRA